MNDDSRIFLRNEMKDEGMVKGVKVKRKPNNEKETKGWRTVKAKNKREAKGGRTVKAYLRKGGGLSKPKTKEKRKVGGSVQKGSQIASQQTKPKTEDRRSDKYIRYSNIKLHN